MAKKIDKDMKKEIQNMIDKELKTGRKALKKDLDMADKKVAEIEGKIKEKPLEWVAGAFLAGMIISKLLK